MINLYCPLDQQAQASPNPLGNESVRTRASFPARESIGCRGDIVLLDFALTVAMGAAFGFSNENGRGSAMSETMGRLLATKGPRRSSGAPAW
jgi:hypothetical protein